MQKTVSEIISNNLFFDLQEGRVDCESNDFYCFKALDKDNFYFGYYHKMSDGRWEANDGAYDLSVTQTTPAQLSIVDEFDLEECATKEEATQRFLDYFATLYQRDYPTLPLSACVENGEASLRQLEEFVGDRVGKLWSCKMGYVLEENVEKPTVALIYDFDGTLSPRNMQEYGFMEALPIMSSDQFWEKTDRLSRETDSSGILCYMKTMLDEAKHSNLPVRREDFINYGKSVELYCGVEQWFDLVNRYGAERGLNIKHYINSSGLKEMIEGTPIAEKFEKIYACSFIYDASGVAVWPGVAVDYTNKTQFIFKINKGIEEVSDNKRINEYVPEDERPIPFKRMIYFGDGETDIPCMKMVKQNGGFSIAVYKPADSSKKRRAEKLILDNRVNFVCPADYTVDREIYKVVTTILDKIKYDYDFDVLLKKHLRSAEESAQR